MHTTASDGRLTPQALVARVHAAGLTTISVTDHDTVAALAEVTHGAAAHGIRVVPGIEITAVADGRDVHMLGYFVDPGCESLTRFLVSQRDLRVGRVREIAARLATLGIGIDAEAILAHAATRPGSSVGRPQLARALVKAGHVASTQDAFERWLANGRPGYVPRQGPSPADVVDAVHRAGGIASMAHPGVTQRDDLIAPLADAGLDAIEVYHSDHSAEDQATYRRLAARFNLLVSGGSDFHGEEPPGSEKPGRSRRATLGVTTLPAEAFAALEAAAASRRRASEARS